MSEYLLDMVNRATILYAGALLFAYAACTHVLDFNSEPESNTLEECQQRNICRNMRLENLRDFKQRNCECDFLCIVFKDCCFDAKARKNSYNSRNRLDTCYRYGIYDEAIYVVGSCPRNYNDSILVKRFCEGLDDFRDPVMSTPVSDTQSASTYRNRYCAECNGVLPSTLIPWTMSLGLDDSYPELTDVASVMNKDFVFSHDLKKFGVCEGDTFLPFEVVFQKPYNVSDVRYCRFNLISSCPSRWRHNGVKKACQSFMGVVHHEHNSYRNIFCAVCNGVDVGQLTCSEQKRFAKNIRQAFLPEPFLQMMDINFTHGDYSGIFSSVEINRYKTVFRKTCKDGTCVFDGYERRDTACPRKKLWNWFW